MTATLSDQRTETEAERNSRRGRFVPWVIAAFYLAFMSALIGFVFIAYAHPPADSTADAYDKGLAYNDTLDKAETQAKLGWRAAASYVDGHASFILQDRDGHPVSGATVKAWFVHPGNPADDRSFGLEEGDTGTYEASAALPAAGVWTLHVTAEKDGRQFQSVATIEAP